MAGYPTEQPQTVETGSPLVERVDPVNVGVVRELQAKVSKREFPESSLTGALCAGGLCKGKVKRVTGSLKGK